jgi:hypothetical protein
MKLKLQHHCLVGLVSMNTPIEYEEQDLMIGRVALTSTGVL